MCGLLVECAVAGLVVWVDFFNWLLFGMRSNRRDAVVCAGYLWKVLFDHNSILMLPFREELTKAGTEGNRQRVGGRGEREVETEGNIQRRRDRGK